MWADLHGRRGACARDVHDGGVVVHPLRLARRVGGCDRRCPRRRDPGSRRVEGPAVASLQMMRAQTIAVLGCLAAALAVGGCGEAQVGDPASAAGHGSLPAGAKSASSAGAGANKSTGASGPAATGAATATSGSSATDAAAGKGASGAGVVHKVADPEEAKSFPLPASVRHRSASTPSVAGEAAVAAGAPSDAEVRRELGEEEHAKAQERVAQQRTFTPVAGGSSVGGNGTIPIPTNVPEPVQRVIAGGNAIADFPYIWGGGHARSSPTAMTARARSATHWRPAGCSALRSSRANWPAGANRARGAGSRFTPTRATRS